MTGTSRALDLPRLSRVRELLSYDAESGIFHWNCQRPGSRPNGEAGSITRHRYITICIDGTNYYAHRLAWLIHHGSPPTNQIDHINGDGTDNRAKNLRDVTHAQNAWNRPIQKNNQCGRKGVMLDPRRGKWVARIRVNKTRIFLGSFDSIDAAADAYQLAVKKNHT